MTVLAYLGLGANLGDAQRALAGALAALQRLPGCSDLRASPTYRSAPIDSSGPDYLNAVASLQTTLSAEQLLAQLQSIEATHGRERPYRNAPRTLDLDLLLFGDQVIDSAHLTVPHPRMHERAFVLRPLFDLSPGVRIPGCGAVADLLVDVQAQTAERLS